MAACVAIRDRTWTDLPMKVDLGPASLPFSSSRLRMWSALDEPSGRRSSGSKALPQSPIAHSPLAADEELMRLRFRTDSSLGFLASPYLPKLEPTAENKTFTACSEVNARNRFRTESQVVMPTSPWGSLEGMGMGARGPGAGCWSVAVPPLPAQPVVPENPSAQCAPLGLSGLPGNLPHYNPAKSVTREIELSALLEPRPVVEAPVERSPVAPSLTERRTSVMLRNLPRGFTFRMLLDLLDSRGFAGCYDFAYLPVNFETMTCLSHAFVNMVSPTDAERLREQLEGFSDWALPSDNVCQVVWNDKHQGLSALVDRYRNSPVMHPDMPEQCKPILLSGGRRIQFPPPTQRVKSPKMRRNKA